MSLSQRKHKTALDTAVAAHDASEVFSFNGHAAPISDDGQDVRVLPNVDAIFRKHPPLSPSAVGRVREVLGIQYGPVDLLGTPSKPVAWVTIEEKDGRLVSGRVSVATLATVVKVLQVALDEKKNGRKR